MSFMANSPENLAFLDGYLYRVLVKILRSGDIETTGLYDFYLYRIEQCGVALSNYDKVLIGHALANFAPQARRVVHAGIGLGTLASALVVAGYKVAGIERDPRRFRAASSVRAALADAWPGAAERYELIEGEFPTALDNTSWVARDAVLIFTNCGAGWTDELTERIIASFPNYGDVILDTRLFGNTRDLPAEREQLLERIAPRALAAQPIDAAPNAFYYHMRY
jgi:hypothetical protein